MTILKRPYFIWLLRLCFLLWAVFMTFVHLVPFNWAASAITPSAIDVFFNLNPFREHTGRVSLAFDAGLNALIFVPAGFALWVHNRYHPVDKVSLGAQLILTALFAVVLQALQLFLPRRVAALSDSMWNTFGLCAGVAVAWLIWKAWQEIRQAHPRRSVT